LTCFQLGDVFESNPNALGLKQMENDEETTNRKRYKTDDQAGTSKVIMIRGIPADCMESELISLVNDFGNVSKTLIIGMKRIGFIEMDSVEIASQVLQHFSSNPAYVREEPINMQFSTRQEITPNSRYSNNANAFGRMVEGGTQVSTRGGARLEGDPNTILLVTIVNMRIPVTIENLYQVFRTFGEVLRIVTFEKRSFQALVEFSNIPSAVTAKQQLEDKDMFQGCCTLLISYSRMKAPLKVIENNHRARDFTAQNPVVRPNNLFSQQQQASFSQQQASFSQQQASFSQQQPGFSAPLQFGVPPPRFADGFDVQHQQQVPPMDGHQGTVLLVHNLNQEKVNPDVIFTLFGVYGDVLRVKIMFNKKDTALVQFATTAQAARARRYLDKLSLYGNEISIISSKHPSIKLRLPSNYDPSGEMLCKDYTESRLHRFKIPNSRNEQHISPPSSILHLSNLPEDTTEEDLTNLFSDDDKTGILNGMKLFGKDRRMALVSFDSISIATHYLIRYHNHPLHGKMMKINFSFKKDNQQL